MKKSLKEAFEEKFEKTEGCWIWKGAVGGTRSKRPQIRYNWKCLYGARVSWLLYKGEEPTSNVCHTCDNPLCVNPDHLFLGDQRVNMRDASRKGRFTGRATINEEVVRTVKELRGNGPKLTDIASTTGVSYGQVGSILYGKRWND